MARILSNEDVRASVARLDGAGENDLLGLSYTRYH